MRDKINNCFFFSGENVNVCLFMLAHQYGQFDDRQTDHLKPYCVRVCVCVYQLMKLMCCWFLLDVGVVQYFGAAFLVERRGEVLS